MEAKQIEAIVDAAARKAVAETFSALGVDLSSPKGLRDAQDDFRYIRFMRELQTKVGSDAIGLVIKLVVGGVLVALATKLGYPIAKNMLN